MVAISFPDLLNLIIKNVIQTHYRVFFRTQLLDAHWICGIWLPCSKSEKLHYFLQSRFIVTFKISSRTVKTHTYGFAHLRIETTDYIMFIRSSYHVGSTQPTWGTQRCDWNRNIIQFKYTNSHSFLFVSSLKHWCKTFTPLGWFANLATSNIDYSAQ